VLRRSYRAALRNKLQIDLHVRVRCLKRLRHGADIVFTVGRLRHKQGVERSGSRCRAARAGEQYGGKTTFHLIFHCVLAFMQ